MTHNRPGEDNKQTELLKYRDLVLATIDYYLHNKLMQIKTGDFDSEEHYKRLKEQAKEHYQEGRLTRLKQWFTALTQMQTETLDWNFNTYLKNRTNYNVDIFESYFQRVDKVIAKGKITTGNQFYDVNNMVDLLCQADPVDSQRIEVLNKLLVEYEQRKSLKIRKPDA